MSPINVVVNGALGKMGREVVKAVCSDPDLKLVGAVEAKVTGNSLPLPDGSGTVPFSADLDGIVTATHPDVLVDFTVAQACMPAARIAVKRGVNLVIGTTGLTTDDIKEIERLAKASKVGVVVAPNFALGAILMIHLAKIAAKYMDSAEIIELHHNQKADSPSGTALATAKAMAAARGKPFRLSPQQSKAAEARGKSIDEIAIHSIRLPGLMAHQEVLLGGQGQTLSIRHDTINRECYMPGVIIAIKEVVNRKGLTFGLDTLLGL
ncbi:MAG: 4-hydroxy-tetrahydrodipicolinate reductase [Chloroflexota bacterium]|nr:4-hydroxy-tetrahydrodipicolinate reductase [Chloroflexota bacterium]